MRKTAWVLATGLVFVCSLAAQSQRQLGRELTWAFPAKVESNAPPIPETPVPKTLPGSKKMYTQAQVDDLANPPDWYPEDHGPLPRVVSDGGVNKGFACGSCHLMSGYGHPESSDLVDLQANYIIRQMADFKSGARKEPIRMEGIARATSDEDTRAAAEYFANVKPRQEPWVKVIETEMVSVTYLGPGRMRFAKPGAGMEPIGNRIIMVPQDVERARLRDPRSGFIAYVPVGSLAKGKILVENPPPGKTTTCQTCHDNSLNGLGNVPRIAGHHPIYTVRQLYMFKDGSRNGPDAPPMQDIVSTLSDADFLNIAAYLGSLH